MDEEGVGREEEEETATVCEGMIVEGGRDRCRGDSVRAMSCCC
jgi:hypothetical protein